MRYAYTYTLLRYRHDPVAGEAINIGIVLHCKSPSLLVAKVRRTVGRLTKVFPGVEKTNVMDVLRLVERQVERINRRDLPTIFETEGNALTYAKRCLADEDSSFVWSEVRSGVSSDPEATLGKLYDRFVSRYDDEVRSTRDDLAVWRPLQSILAERGIADRLQPKQIFSSLDQVSFEHAWKNGAWHCYQPLSLDLSSAETIRDKAARWSGHMTGLTQSLEDFKPYFLVGRPAAQDLQSDYERAINLLRASAMQPTVYEEHEVVAMADAIEDEMRSHDHETATVQIYRS